MQEQYPDLFESSCMPLSLILQMKVFVVVDVVITFQAISIFLSVLPRLELVDIDPKSL